MIKRVIEMIRKHRRFLVTSHVNPEPDALGSELAFARLVTSLGKKVIVCNDAPYPYEYHFLPFVDTIRLAREVSSQDYDAAVVVDCSDLLRLGRLRHIIPQEKLILNIDHHIRNTLFAKVNWVMSGASSCAELIYRLYKAMKVPLDKEVALLLYAALVSDTGSFKYSNTGAYTHRMAADLLRYKLPVNQVYQQIYGNITFSDYCTILKHLQSIRRSGGGKIIYFESQKGLLKTGEGISDLSDYVLDFARSIREVEVVIIFRKVAARQIRVSFRSKGRVDVCRLAQYFGGGGHRTASGCTIQDTFSAAKAIILSKTKSLLRELQ